MPLIPASKIPEIPIQEPNPITGRIAWHIENTLTRIGKKLFNAIALPFKTMLSLAISEFLEIIEPGVLKVTDPILSNIADLEGLDTNTQRTINMVRQGGHQSDSILAILYSIAGIMGYMTGPMSIKAKQSSQAVDSIFRTGRPAPDALWAMMHRDPGNEGEYMRGMADTGWADVYIKAWEQVTRPLVSGGDMSQALLRGELSDNEFVGELTARGYSKQSINIIQKLMWQIPGPQDLIRMAVREAWQDQTARTFGYDEDFPAEFGQWTEKIGLSAEWAKRYWRAHWELPGLREGFEMLHREVIKPAELEMMMRARDIPVFWRKRLMDISYTPYTRVDVRRMYQAGVLNEEDVNRSYKDIGYDDERAAKMTEWTVAEYQQEGKELAKGDVLSAYKDGIITDADAFGYLSSLDYEEDEIFVLLSRIDLQKESQYEKELVENVRVSFVGGVIEENDVYSQLGSINPPAGFIEERLKLWRLQRDRAIKRPTLAQLRDFWVATVIDEPTLDEQMKRLGYNATYIKWFKELWKGVVQ